MRAVLQRVSSASVTVESSVTGQIDRGLVVLLGIEEADTSEDVDWLAAKIVNLRLFADASGSTRRSLCDVAGSVLLISQFTLLASTKKGNAPGWHRAAKPELAVPLYEQMVSGLEVLCGRPIATGRFGATMQVALVNDGPVTLWLDTKARE